MANIKLDAALAAIGAGIHIVAAPYTDISNQLIAAQATLGATGGKIYIPAGVFYAQNIPIIDGIYFEGAGEIATQLKLPNGAIQSMFVASGSVYYGWGFKGIYFSGIYSSILNSPLGAPTDNPRSRFNCIDLAAAQTVWIGLIENCRFEYFNCAYSGASASAGTNFDLYVRFDNCVFQYNSTACEFSEHIQLSNCFFLANGSTNGSALNGGGAITGRLNDCTVRNCWFVSNYQGAYSTGGGSSIFNTQFIGCLFAAQKSSDLMIDAYCTVTGCAFWGLGSSTTYGIVLKRGNHTITGNKFNEGGGSYQGACIRVSDDGTAMGFYSVTVTSNLFYLGDDPTGPAIDFSGMINASSNARCWSITANTVYTNRSQFIKSHLFYSSELSINNNSFYLTGDYTSGTPIALVEMYTVEGNTFIGNSFYCSGVANKANILGGVIRSTLVVGNRLSSTNAAIINMVLRGGTGSDIVGFIAQNNSGYITRNSGNALFAGAIRVPVIHGLANTPNIQDIQLTAQGPVDAPPWVSDVTSTQFIINFSVGSTTSVGWCASCNN